MKTKAKKKELTIFIILLIISAIITINNPSFLTLENLFDMAKSNTVLMIMSMGMLLVILSGGIDVSAASMVAAVTVVVGNFLMSVSGNIFLAFGLGACTGIILGLINGALIVRFKIPPIVVTLGTMSMIIGMVLYLTNGVWITGIPASFISFGRLTLGGPERKGLPIQILFMLAIIALTWWILKFTIWGRGVYAIGGNRNSAERLGFNVSKITLFIYAYEGFLIGIAGVVHTTIMQQVDPNAFIGFELQVIAAVVLGGASVLGGYGSVLGTVIGVALFSVINNGLILMRIPTFWQKIVLGLVILVSVSADVIQKRIQENKTIKVDIEEA